MKKPETLTVGGLLVRQLFSLLARVGTVVSMLPGML